MIPVEPMTKSFQIRLTSSERKEYKSTVRRRQYLMTAAYGFTDYRSQGQTIPHAVIDIATPPTGGLSLFNHYVALSRSSGRATIRLLRDFNDKLFQASYSPDLLAKDERLEELDKNTREWRQKWGGAGRNQLQRQQSVLRKYYPSQRSHSGARRNLTKQINCVNHHQHITGRKFQRTRSHELWGRQKPCQAR